jgi:hypothetical protein
MEQFFPAPFDKNCQNDKGQTNAKDDEPTVDLVHIHQNDDLGDHIQPGLAGSGKRHLVEMTGLMPDMVFFWFVINLFQI